MSYEQLKDLDIDYALWLKEHNPDASPECIAFGEKVWLAARGEDLDFSYQQALRG